jgi:hypothetical protein
VDRPLPQVEVRVADPATAPRTSLGKIQKFLLQHDLLETEQGPDGRHRPA